MDREDVRVPLGWTLVALGVFLIYGTLWGKSGGPLFPQLVPFFGTAFAIAFLLVLAGIGGLYHPHSAVPWLIGGLVAGLIVGMISEARLRPTSPPPHAGIERQLEKLGRSAYAYDWTRHVVISTVSWSAMALGFGLATDKIVSQRRSR